MEEKTYVYKGETITEYQITYLIKDRKQLLEECKTQQKEIGELKKKIKSYEKIIGLHTAVILVTCIFFMYFN